MGKDNKLVGKGKGLIGEFKEFPKSYWIVSSRPRRLSSTKLFSSPNLFLNSKHLF